MEGNGWQMDDVKLSYCRNTWHSEVANILGSLTLKSTRFPAWFHWWFPWLDFGITNSQYGCFPNIGGFYPPKWMVNISWKTPMNKWMIWGETPLFFGNTQICLFQPQNSPKEWLLVSGISPLSPPVGWGHLSDLGSPQFWWFSKDDKWYTWTYSIHGSYAIYFDNGICLISEAIKCKDWSVIVVISLEILGHGPSSFW